MASTAHGTLTANVVTTVVVTPGWQGIEVVNRANQGVIWVRIDGADPVPEADDSYAVLGARQFPIRRDGTADPISVKLISDAGRGFSVEAAG